MRKRYRNPIKIADRRRASGAGKRLNGQCDLTAGDCGPIEITALGGKVSAHVKYSMSKVEKLRRRADFGKRRGYQERYHRHQRKILRSLIVTLSTEFHNTTLN